MNYNLSNEAKIVMKEAIEIAKTTSDCIGTEHILYGITKVDSSSASSLLKEYNCNSESLYNILIKKDVKSIPSTIEYSARAKEMIFLANSIAKKVYRNTINTEDLLLAILSQKNSYAIRIVSEICKAPILILKNKAVQVISNNKNNLDSNQYTTVGNIKSNIDFLTNINSENFDDNDFCNTNNKISDFLSSVGYDMTEKARNGQIDKIIGREKELERIIEVLGRKTKNNPILIGEAGVGKTAIIEGLAQKIASGDVPNYLKNKILFSLDLSSMMQDTRYRGQIEEKAKKLVDTIIENSNIIVFIDEIHMLAKSSVAGAGDLGLADILKPFLARGQMQTIGATTTEEYRKYIESDKALERRFQSIMLEPPTAETTLTILKGIKHAYEYYHNVTITDSAIEIAVSLGEKYIADRNFPDKALDLLDEAASRKKSKSINNIENIVDAEDIAEVLSKWIGIPVTKITQTESEKLIKLEEKLSERVIGQKQAIESVSKAIRRSRVSLSDGNRPIGSFLFVGSTGVGKTHLAKSIAEIMFDSEKNIIRLDMSEYMESHSVSKLIGSPPGYVGYDDAGLLTEPIRRKPYSVVLLDEIEKAHPDVLNLLLQILDDGRLTDSHGKVVSFKNALIIMTSNVGGEKLSGNKNMGFGGDGIDNYELIKDDIKKRFRPEFINRIDNIAVFNPLTKEDTISIAKIMLTRINKIMLKKGVKIRFTENTVNYLAENGSSREYGARPLRRLIISQIEDPLADIIIENKLKGITNIVVDEKDSKLVFLY